MTVLIHARLTMLCAAIMMLCSMEPCDDAAITTESKNTTKRDLVKIRIVLSVAFLVSSWSLLCLWERAPPLSDDSDATGRIQSSLASYQHQRQTDEMLYITTFKEHVTVSLVRLSRTKFYRRRTTIGFQHSIRPTAPSAQK